MSETEDELLDKEEEEVKLIVESSQTLTSERGKKEKKKSVSFDIIPEILRDTDLSAM
jgi:uncharacterized circularly permuted ATP-grasp superfamily protein